MITSIFKGERMIDFKNKKVLVFGLGLHGGGVAVAKWLAQEGAKITVVDIKTKTELRPSLNKLKDFKIRYYFATNPDDKFLDFDYIIKNPGVPRQHPFLKLAKINGIPIYNEASLFFSLVKNPIIGITGSKGKSTTTDLVGHIFKAHNRHTLVGGNIQITPMFSLINRIKDISPIILELSSWHLEGLPLIKKSPQLAVITNIFPDHLDRYKDFSDYAKAKSIILRYQKNSDIAVLNYDNLDSRRLAGRVRGRTYWFGVKDFKQYKNLSGVFIKSGWAIWQQGKVEKIINLKSVKLKGEHNLSNILASICVAKLQGIDNSIISQVISGYQGLPNRLELVRKVRGVSFYNDTTATAPVATIAALNSFSRPVILLAGGSDKELPLKDLANNIKRRAKYCLLFKGQGSDRLISELVKVKYPQAKLITHINTMSEMIAQAQRLAKVGDVVLLSPGFASFSNFSNEFDRGRQFIKSVKRIK